jgi:cytochrome c556
MLGAAMKTIEDESKSRSPDFKKIGDSANTILTVGKDILQWFPAGTGPESGFETNARPQIWSDPARFKALHAEFMAEAKRLTDAAASGDGDSITGQYYTTGVACANCHKPFRVDRD